MSQGPSEIAVTGLSCSGPGTEGVQRFWRRLLNGDDSSGGPSTGSAFSDETSSLSAPDDTLGSLVQVIRKGLEDAGFDSGSSLSGRVRIIVGPYGREERDSFASRMVGEGLTEHEKSVVFLGQHYLTDLEKELSALDDGHFDMLILAAEDSSFEKSGREGARESHAAALVMERRTDVESRRGAAYALCRVPVFPGRGYEKGTGTPGARLEPEDVNLFVFGGRTEEQASVLQDIFGLEQAGKSLRPVTGLTRDVCNSDFLYTIFSLIETSLCVNNKIIPAATEDMAGISGSGRFPLYPVCGTRPWIHDDSLPPRLAAVIIGDACFFLSEIPEGSDNDLQPRPIDLPLNWESELLLFSAAGREDLVCRIAEVSAFLESSGPDVAFVDIAFSLVESLDPGHSHRLALICGNREEFESQLALCHAALSRGESDFSDMPAVYYSQVAAEPVGKLACIFPGNGFPGVAEPCAGHLLELCLRFPAVRAVFDQVECRRQGDDELSSHLFFPPGYLPDNERKRLRARLAAPRVNGDRIGGEVDGRSLAPFGVAVANWAGWQLFQEMALEPDMMFGQSHGEISALCAAGMVDFSHIIPLHWQAEYSLDSVGAVASHLSFVKASAEDLAQYIGRFSETAVAIHLAPELQVVGGSTSQMDALEKELRQAGIWFQPLPYPAIHTSIFSPLRSIMGSYLEKVEIHASGIPVYSGKNAEPYPASTDEVRENLIDLLDRSVFFWQAVKRMYDDGSRIFAQVGGGSNLHAMISTMLKGWGDGVAVSIDVDHAGAVNQLERFCAVLFVQGYFPDLSFLYAGRSANRLEIFANEKEKEFASRRSSGESKEDKVGPVQEGLAEKAPQEERFARIDNNSEMPFIGEVLLYREGREIIIKRILDLTEDLYLADHCLVNTRGYKPVSAQEPILPMTFGMEMAAEAAACLAPGMGFIGFEEFRAARWVGLEDCSAMPLHIVAKMRNRDEPAGLSEVWVGIYPEGQKTPSMEARVVFGSHYRMTVEPQFSEFARPRNYPLKGREIYRDKHLFHGPLLQCISGDITFTDKALLGELTVSSSAGLFRSFSRPELLTDPVINDGIGQLVGMWSLGYAGRYALPISTGRIEYYRTTPPPGTKVNVFLEVSGMSSRMLKTDVEVQDGEGAVWFRIKDWTQWVFDWSDRVIHSNRNPLTHCVGKEVDFPGMTRNGSVACEVAKDDIRGLTPQMIARSCLHMDEMELFRQKAAYPERQVQWLLGRIAAKDAARIWVAGGGEMAHPVTFMIENNDQGQPSVLDLPGEGPAPHISISHCDNRALAIAHARPVGIDLERIVHREETFFKKMGTEGEHALLARFSGEMLDEWITRIWCAKEAAGKMLGTGVDGAPQGFEAVEVEPGGRVCIFHHRSSTRISVKTCRKDMYIAACAFAEEDSGNMCLAQDKVVETDRLLDKSLISQ